MPFDFTVCCGTALSQLPSAPWAETNGTPSKTTAQPLASAHTPVWWPGERNFGRLSGLIFPKRVSHSAQTRTCALAPRPSPRVALHFCIRADYQRDDHGDSDFLTAQCAPVSTHRSSSDDDEEFLGDDAEAASSDHEGRAQALASPLWGICQSLQLRLSFCKHKTHLLWRTDICLPPCHHSSRLDVMV